LLATALIVAIGHQPRLRIALTVIGTWVLLQIGYGTHFLAPKTSHSTKPDDFYALFERASYPPFVDVFARKKRPGWTTWGNIRESMLLPRKVA
jgi:N6-adenosine-specific RNA methylase IME4